MASDHKSTAGLLLIRFVVTILLIWLMSTYIDQYFFVSGGWGAYVVIAALITLLNFLLRPALNVILLPLKFFASFIAIILANTFFVWVVREISLNFDASIVTFDVKGILGWIIAGAAFGITNWILTH